MDGRDETRSTHWEIFLEKEILDLRGFWRKSRCAMLPDGIKPQKLL
jgi:hypothetical protein